MKTKATAGASQVLTDLLNLTPEERLWVREQDVGCMDADEREELQALLAEESRNPGQVAHNLDDQARERLMEDPGLAAGEKVLLAALILRELYEVKEFHSRQITEYLKEASNTVNNITAALNGLISKGEAEVAGPDRTAKNVHKRYQLTAAGISAAVGLARIQRPTSVGIEVT